MDAVTRTEIDADTPVTTVIRHRPRPEAVARYEAWLKEIIPVAQGFAGHRGVNVIRPHAPGGAYTIVLHFDSDAHLRDWLDSPQRAQLLAKMKDDLHDQESIEIETGFEFWFSPPPAAKPARPWKQFLLTLSAIFPLSLLAPFAADPIFRLAPALVGWGWRQLVLAALIVAAMVWVVMPRYTRFAAKWLFA